MVGGALARVSTFRVGLGVSGATIVSGSCAYPSHLWISRVLTSSSSLGISSLFCRATQCMRHVSSTLAFSLSSHRLVHKFCLAFSIIINNNFFSLSRFVINSRGFYRKGIN
jgi:hypothetical protein